MPSQESNPRPDRRQRSELRHVSVALAELLPQIKPTVYRFGCPPLEQRGDDNLATDAVLATARWRDHLLDGADPADAAEQGELRDRLEQLAREVADLVDGAVEWSRQGAF